MDQHVATEQDVWDFVSQFYSISVLSPIVSDASQRQYWRVTTKKDSFVVMDSPPDVADITLFTQLADWLLGYGIPVPKIFQKDPDGRFLIMEDLGDLSLYCYLQQTQSIKTLQQPLAVLKPLSQLPRPDFLPEFTREEYLDEAKLFDEWCLKPLSLGVNPGAFDSLYELLADSAMSQPQGFVHRDFHSYNIFFCQEKPLGIGLIDFQDAVWGPRNYDLISLLLDRYITWPKQELFELIDSFRVNIGSLQSPSEFLQQVLYLGLQRNLRILGVFHRLSIRDKKPLYMRYVPRKAHYCHMILNHYAELKPYALLFETVFRNARW